MSRPKPVISSVHLAPKLLDAATPSTDPIRVALTCLATAQLLTSRYASHGARQLRELADDHNLDRVKAISLLWEDFTEEFEYLAEVVNPLVGWADSPGDTDAEATRRCCAILSKLEISDCLAANRGELLTGVFLTMLPDAERAALERIFVPIGEMAQMTAQQGLRDDAYLLDINCGGGGREIGIILDMLRRGQNPANLTMILTEQNALAAAMAAINMATYGMPRLVMMVTDTPWEDTDSLTSSIKILHGGIDAAFFTPTIRNLRLEIEEKGDEEALAAVDAMIATLGSDEYMIGGGPSGGGTAMVQVAKTGAHRIMVEVGDGDPEPPPGPAKKAPRKKPASKLNYDPSLDGAE